ncbi:hypothetical protein J3Q64DRAFT_1760867 [Phycomyces blakesleeanus]
MPTQPANQFAIQKEAAARKIVNNPLKRKFEFGFTQNSPYSSSSASSYSAISSSGIPMVITSKTNPQNNKQSSSYSSSGVGVGSISGPGGGSGGGSGSGSGSDGGGTNPNPSKKAATAKTKSSGLPPDQPESLSDRGRIIILNVEPTSKKPRVICRTPAGDIVLGHPNEFDEACHSQHVNRSDDLHVRNYNKVPYFVCRDGNHWKIIGPVSRIEPVVRDFILKKGSSQVPEL